MNIKIKSIALIVLTLLVVVACKKGPKVIYTTTDAERSSKSSGIFDRESSSPTNPSTTGTLSNDIHTVVVKEILPASKYNYLKVTEGDEEFWIAIRKQEVKVGETYFYKRALLKTNFESKEHNKVFDKIYLVTSLVQSNHGNNSGTLTKDTSHDGHNHETETKKITSTTTDKVVQKEGSIKISDLVKDPKKYEGKTVQITGKCVKVNPNIMNRNWLHIKDGTKDDFDLVITSDKFAPEGSVVTMKALVTLNKDFGAGYKYDLILENGTIVK